MCGVSCLEAMTLVNVFMGLSPPRSTHDRSLSRQPQTRSVQSPRGSMTMENKCRPRASRGRLRNAPGAPRQAYRWRSGARGRAGVRLRGERGSFWACSPSMAAVSSPGRPVQRAQSVQMCVKDDDPRESCRHHWKSEFRCSLHNPPRTDKDTAKYGVLLL